jgi:hypothetical protein
LLCERIEDERLRRIRDGSCKRERAQQLVINAPWVLGDIMSDPAANNRHRVDAIKTLDSIATPPAQAAADSSRFVIQINLGDDHVEHYSKSRTIDANDVDPYAAPAGTVVALPTKKLKKIAKKSENDDGDEPV